MMVLQAYLAGFTFALVASPCSTPILATLLAFVSQTQDPILGGSLLLAYTTGYNHSHYPAPLCLLGPDLRDVGLIFCRLLLLGINIVTQKHGAEIDQMLAMLLRKRQHGGLSHVHTELCNPGSSSHHSNQKPAVLSLLQLVA